MTICKYYLQGTCRFGDSCKFEHQINNEQTYANATSILLHNYASKPPQPPTNVDTSTLVKSVVNDMTSAEKGGQWLLSSYAPFKEKPAFPGFEDHSMEEIRYLFYESMKSGSIEQYKQNLQLMLKDAIIKIKALQNPSPDAVNMLKQIYNTPPSSSFTNNQAPFNSGASSSSVFGGSQLQQQKSVFGNGAPPNQSVFGGSTAPPNVFQSLPQQQSVFGGSSNANSIFGAQAQPQSGSTVFGNNPQQQVSTNPIFGGTQPAPATKSIFGGATTIIPVNTTSQIFGGQAQPSAFGQHQQASPFGQVQPQQQVQTTPFAQQVQTGSFNQQQQPTFAPQPQPNVFVQNQNDATGNNKSVTFQHTASIFGNPAQQAASGSSFDSNSARGDEDFYSKLEELTEEEIKWFQSDDLDIAKIPDKPPTYEMCFKV